MVFLPPSDGSATWLAAVAAAVMLLVGCADDAPSATAPPTEAQEDAQEAACQAAGDLRDLLSAAGSDTGPEQVDRITEAVRELADAANRSDDPELRSNASHLLVEWEQTSKRQGQPTPPADADAVSEPLQAIAAECERLDVRGLGTSAGP